MADQNTPQTPQVGVVGNQGQQAQAPQQAPQGLPGVQGPPVPSAELIAKVMAEQQAVTQKQIQVAQVRAGYDGVAQAPPAAPANNRFSNPAPQNAVPAPEPQQSAQASIPNNIAAQMPPSMRPQQPPQQQPAPQPAPSPISGLTASQVLAGPPRQPVTQQQQQGTQFSQFAQPEETVKESVFWYPVRGGKDIVEIELTDYVMKNVPGAGVQAESDPAAKVMLVLFSEILALREQVAWLVQNAQQPQVDAGLAQKVQGLENAMYEQRGAMTQRARGVREQIELGQAQGLTPDQILASLSGQQAAAQQMTQQASVPAAQHTGVDQQAAAQASMIAQGTGQSPESQQVTPSSDEPTPQ